MFALELDARLREQGSHIRSLAAHPGIARTDLQPTAIASVGNRFEALAYRLMDPCSKAPAWVPCRNCMPPPRRLLRVASTTALSSSAACGVHRRSAVWRQQRANLPNGSGFGA